MSAPSSELGPPPPPPLLQASVSRKQRGVTHSPAVEGVGVPYSDDWRKSQHSVYAVLTSQVKLGTAGK
jgi:hypothetical protein